MARNFGEIQDTLFDVNFQVVLFTVMSNIVVFSKKLHPNNLYIASCIAVKPVVRLIIFCISEEPVACSSTRRELQEIYLCLF